ncbi:peptidylprolyl isomerase [Chloroflexota bacterium]
MAKKKAEKPQRIFTKHQLSRWEQQKRRRRITLGVVITVIIAVLGLVGVGWYTTQYQPFQKTAIRVNDTEFNMRYYVEMIKIYSWNQPTSSIQSLADDVIESIERNELVKQEALNLGISISDDETEEGLENYQLPDDDVHRDLVNSQLLLRKLLDNFAQQLPESAKQTHLMVMLLESESQANEIRARIGNSENFTDLAGEFSLNYFLKINNGDLGWHPEVILKEILPINIAERAFELNAGTLSQPIYDEETTKETGYWLIRVLHQNKDEEEAHTQIMLLGNEEEAQEVRSRLEAGEDFATLAKEFSQLDGVEENEGEYMLSPGFMTPAVDEYVFNPERDPETISEPIRDEYVITKGGYWLIKVVDRDEDRPLGDDDKDLLKAKALDEWAASLWENPEHEIDDSYLDAEKKVWAVEQAISELE